MNGRTRLTWHQPFALMECAIDIYGPLHDHFGAHLQFSTPESLRHFFQATFTFELAYNFAIVLPKFSMIALYWRVFGLASIKWPLLATATVTLIFFLACVWLYLLHIDQSLTITDSYGHIRLQSYIGLLEQPPGRALVGCLDLEYATRYLFSLASTMFLTTSGRRCATLPSTLCSCCFQPSLSVVCK